MKKIIFTQKQSKEKYLQPMKRLNHLFQRYVLFIVRILLKIIRPMAFSKKMEQVSWFPVQSVVYGFMQVNTIFTLKYCIISLTSFVLLPSEKIKQNSLSCFLNIMEIYWLYIWLYRINICIYICWKMKYSKFCKFVPIELKTLDLCWVGHQVNNGLWPLPDLVYMSSLNFAKCSNTNLSRIQQRL